MKVNAITNTNFRGLFTDRTKENGGNWRMEYRPYSWEGKTKAPKVQLDIYSTVLPTNEEIYTEISGYKESKDILGTVSYFDDKRNGRDIVRRTISDMPSMSLEDSLKVQDKKLKAFIELKQEAMKELKEPLSNRDMYLYNLSHWHGEYVTDVKRNLGSHVYEKYERAKGLEQNCDKIVKFAEELGDNFEKYTKLSESADSLRSQRERIGEVLFDIENAKNKGLLVDISRRDIKDANEPLKEAFKNIERAKKSLFALSNGTISGSKIMEAVGENFSIEKAISYVESLMRKKI